MSIDLSKCIGCNACMVACTAENNVPIVGKARVLKGREMHWIRVDRYFGGADPGGAHRVAPGGHLPAVRERPVRAGLPGDGHRPQLRGAQRHGLQPLRGNALLLEQLSLQGAAVQLLQLSQGPGQTPDNEVLKMLYNPEVTVRSRGVMEKCTYCVQRIQAVKIDAKNQKRPIRDGEIRTACQQACPAQAIVFGDLADPA